MFPLAVRSIPPGRTLDSGHYVTYWRSQDGWIEINDASERSIDATTAERKAGDAYLLIYELAGYQGVRTLSGHIPGRVLSGFLFVVLAHAC